VKTRLTAVSFAAALATAVYVIERVIDTDLVKADGAYILIPVFFPAWLAAMALLLRKQWVRIVAAVLLAIFVIIAGFSIGLFYAPAAFLMLLAACVSDSAKLRDAFS
jgi:hypothetical protein